MDLQLGETIIICDVLDEWQDAKDISPSEDWHMALGIKYESCSKYGLSFGKHGVICSTCLSVEFHWISQRLVFDTIVNFMKNHAHEIMAEF